MWRTVHVFHALKQLSHELTHHVWHCLLTQVSLREWEGVSELSKQASKLSKQAILAVCLLWAGESCMQNTQKGAQQDWHVLSSACIWSGLVADWKNAPNMLITDRSLYMRVVNVIQTYALQYSFELEVKWPGWWASQHWCICCLLGTWHRPGSRQTHSACCHVCLRHANLAHTPLLPCQAFKVSAMLYWS